MAWRDHLKETKTAWKKVLRPKVLLTTTAIIFLLLLLYGFFLLYKVVTADLTIMFWPNDVYVTESQASVTLRANNYLLCQATCNLTLTQNNELLAYYPDVLLRNNDFEATFDLKEPPRGEGKEVYVVRAVCLSTGFTACYKREELTYESALVVHKYSLSQEDERARDELTVMYPFFLETLRETDELLIQAEAIQELLLLPQTTTQPLREELYDLLLVDEQVREALAQWFFEPVPLERAQALNNESVVLFDELLVLLFEENIRRETINNLSIDERIGYVFEQTTTQNAWASFINNYAQGRGAILPLQYRALTMHAQQLLIENLTQEGHNLTNLSFEEQWVLFCDNCTPTTINQTDLQLLVVPEKIGSVIERTFVMPQPSCPQCSTGNPVLFLHGHSMNQRNDPEWQLGTFTTLVRDLSAQELLLDAGVMTPYSATVPIPRNAWQDLRVGVRGTYYYDAYLAGGSYVLSWEQSESIDTYAIRVRELVNTIRERTGAAEVDVVAHSMGGLVARRYVQLFGDDNVGQIITIGTPHYGTQGVVSRLCPLFGADKECVEMRAGSAMLSRINDPKRQPRTPITSIVGYGCETNGEDGDGIITRRSASLEGSTIYAFEGSCEEDYYHSLIVRDERVILLVEELLRTN